MPYISLNLLIVFPVTDPGETKRPGPPLCQGLDDWAPPLSGGLDPPLVFTENAKKDSADIQPS